jgi:nanoRNase/pAp phosphatase (c-di-AMP/oligoRNAs hydrolase)
MHSEVVATPAEFSRAERGVFAWLSRWVDHGLLRRIADAPLSKRYFEDLSAALDGTRLYDGVSFTILRDAGSAEIVGEVADLLIRCRPVHRVFCGAIVEGEIVCSARTSPEGGDAVEHLGKALAGVGHLGGHPHRAGGKVPRDAEGRTVSREIVEDVRRRWLKACEVEGVDGIRLVDRA